MDRIGKLFSTLLVTLSFSLFVYAKSPGTLSRTYPYSGLAAPLEIGDTSVQSDDTNLDEGYVHNLTNELLERLIPDQSEGEENGAAGKQMAEYHGSKRNKTSKGTLDTVPPYCEICKCKWISHFLYTDCSSRSLSKPFVDIDNMTSVLIYRGNRISRLDYHYFRYLDRLKYLDLSRNKIDYMRTGTFKDLVNLEVLRLDGNDFFEVHFVFKNGMFEGLSKVTVLTLNNSLPTHPFKSSVNGQAFSPMASLKYLYIDGFMGIMFDEYFLNTNLTLISMSGTSGKCNIRTLYNDSFIGAPELTALNLDYCNLSSIDSDAFVNMLQLKFLDLSKNPLLGIDGVNVAVKGLVPHKSLSVLKMSVVHDFRGVGSALTRANMASINKLPLSELYMDSNVIEKIEKGAILIENQTLRKLSLKHNHLTLGLYMAVLVYCNPSIEVLNIAFQFDDGNNIKHGIEKRMTDEEYDERAVGLCGDKTAETGATYDIGHTAINLTTFVLSHSRGSGDCITFEDSINHVTSIDLTDNLLRRLQSRCFRNLHNLTYLFLSGNYIEVIDNDAFKDLGKLKVLYLDNNLLGNYLAFGYNGLFDHLTQLQKITLGRNRLYEIRSDVFTACKNLVYLDLSENSLEKFTLDVSSLHQLQSIGLVGNRLQSIGQEQREQLSKLAEKHVLNVDLTDNKIICNCENLPFLEWLYNSKVHFTGIRRYKCTLNNGTIVKMKKDILNFLTTDCNRYLAMIVISTAAIACFVTVVSAKIAYRFRWYILYYYYKYRLKDRSNEPSIDSVTFSWDAFISFADANARMVRDMVEHLETQAGLRLNVRHRDFPLGEVNAVNISNAVMFSRKTVFLLSENFFLNKWCKFELNMAQMEAIDTKREVIVIVLMEELSARRKTPQVLDLLRQCKVVEFPENADHVSMFWNRLSDYIR